LNESADYLRGLMAAVLAGIGGCGGGGTGTVTKGAGVPADIQAVLTSLATRAQSGDCASWMPAAEMF
jgi:hypothetical protein